MARNPNRRPQVHGGFVAFRWENRLIGFADRVRVTTPAPVADAVAVQPMNAHRPIEIVTAGAHRHGVLTLVMTQLYNAPVWARLAGLARSQDFVDISRTLAARGNPIQIVKVVHRHFDRGSASDATATGDYFETFHNCVVTRVGDDEDVGIDTMILNKEIEVWYTHSIKAYVNGGSYQWPRSVETGPTS